MAKKNCTEWLNLKIQPDDKRILVKMSAERDMSMSAICRLLIHDEVRRYERFKATENRES